MKKIFILTLSIFLLTGCINVKNEKIENNVRKVREFIKNINSELLKVFDNLWENNESRLEILSEIELESDRYIKI